MVIPEQLLPSVRKIQDTILICPPAASQHAAHAAMHVGRAYAAPHVEQLDRTRRTVHAELTAPGVPCDVPSAQGAFYYLIRVHTALDSMTLTG